MVVFILYCKANLEGIETLSLSKDANLCFSVRNPLDDAEVREKIVVDCTVLQMPATAEHKTHRDETPSHFAMKWKDATQRSTLRVLGSNSILMEERENDHEKTNKKKKNNMSAEMQKALDSIRDMNGDDSGTFVPMLALDCNGLEPYAFHPLGGEGEFTVVCKSGGKKFENVDLSDGDWSEYELAAGSISITNFESKIE